MPLRARFFACVRGVLLACAVRARNSLAGAHLRREVRIMRRVERF